MERPSGKNLTLSNILRYSMSDDIEHIDEEIVHYLSEPKNAESLCIIFDGLDEYPPAYNDPSNYIYKIINRQRLSPATVIVLSRPEAYKALFETSGYRGYQAYELAGFGKVGHTEYLFRNTNVSDFETTRRFLKFMIEYFELDHQLYTSPFYFTIFVEIFKEFPISLTEVCIKSLTIAIRQEVIRQNLDSAGCSNVQLLDQTSLNECSQHLASTVANISKLAFDSLANNGQNEEESSLSSLKVLSYVHSGNSFGLLFPHSHEKYHFPYIIFEEFWAAYHIATENINLSDLTVRRHIFRHPNILYFLCGMYSSNNTMLHSILEMVLQDRRPYMLFDFTTCGSESGLSSQSLADIYLKLQGASLDLNRLLDPRPYFSQAQVQSFLSIVHLQIRHIALSDASPSLTLYIDARISDMIFPNLEMVSITLSDDNYSFNFTENLKLLFSRKAALPKLKWSLPVKVLIDDDFYSCLDNIADIKVIDMEISVYESHVSNCSLCSQVIMPDMFISAVTIFTNYFHRQLGTLTIHYRTGVSRVKCDTIFALFETLYRSFFFNKVHSFKIMDDHFSVELPRKADRRFPIVALKTFDFRSCDSGLIAHGVIFRDPKDLKNKEICGNEEFYTYYFHSNDSL